MRVGLLGSRALGLCACLLVASCASVPRVPAKATFYGVAIETTVDSEVAKYYLESYLQGANRNPEVHERIASIYRRHAAPLPTREQLALISSDISVDFAALFLADRLLSDECNRKLNRSFAGYLDGKPAAGLDISRYVLLFVPGWDYAENGYLTGADFARPRRWASEFGLENHLVALPPTGSVEENAAALAADLSRRSRSGRQILLAGASSAGPAIHLALGELLPRSERGAIRAWINLGGLLQGSPLVDRVQSGPQGVLFGLVAWAKGWSPESIRSMGTHASRSRFERLRIEGDILIVNYLGVPLSGQLSRYSQDKYPLLRPEGPNDGLTLLSDAIAPRSLTIVALGSDHFFAEDPQIRDKTIALMKLIVTALEADPALRCSR